MKSKSWMWSYPVFCGNMKLQNCLVSVMLAYTESFLIRNWISQSSRGKTILYFCHTPACPEYPCEDSRQARKTIKQNSVIILFSDIHWSIRYCCCHTYPRSGPDEALLYCLLVPFCLPCDKYCPTRVRSKRHLPDHLQLSVQ